MNLFSKLNLFSIVLSHLINVRFRTIYVCMYVCTYVCMYDCVCTRMYEYLPMRVCMNVRMSKCYKHATRL